VIPTHITFCWKENNGVSKRKRSWHLGVTLWFCCRFLASVASAQGPAPETAPPLSRRDSFLQLHFTTRTDLQPAGISLTARPTFRTKVTSISLGASAAEFDCNLVITNHFEYRNPIRMPMSGGTGLGDAMVLVNTASTAGIPTRHYASFCNARPQRSDGPNQSS